MATTLTNHDDIRQWATARGGNPMTMDTPDGTGTRTLLQITFGQHALNSENNEGPDRIGGFQLVSWDEWFEALEDSNLAIRVSEDLGGGTQTDYEFVSRDGEGETTDAAKQPAAITIQSPNPDDHA